MHYSISGLCRCAPLSSLENCCYEILWTGQFARSFVPLAQTQIPNQAKRSFIKNSNYCSAVEIRRFESGKRARPVFRMSSGKTFGEFFVRSASFRIGLKVSVVSVTNLVQVVLMIGFKLTHQSPNVMARCETYSQYQMSHTVC